MTISEHVTEFAGLPIQLYGKAPGLGDAAKKAWLVTLGENSYEPEEPWGDVFARFLKEKGVDQVTTLVVGTWEEMGSGTESTAIAKAVAGAASKLTNLKAFFFGEVTYEECEISWIVHGDVSGIFAAYPKLEHFRIRGSQSLSLGKLKHGSLKSLIVECGGLPSNVVQEVAAADLPALTHLELWLGEDNYGADWTFDDLKPILQGNRFPKLQYLGLRDSEKADEIAMQIAKAPVLQKITTLDLSLGNLSDAGGKALLSAPLQNLKKLDLHHHYLSEAVMKQFRGLAMEVNLEDREEADGDDRYIAVGE